MASLALAPGLAAADHGAPVLPPRTGADWTAWVLVAGAVAAVGLAAWALPRPDRRESRDGVRIVRGAQPRHPTEAARRGRGVLLRPPDPLIPRCMEIAAVAVRWLHAAGAVSLVGIFASLVLVARPAARAAATRGARGSGARRAPAQTRCGRDGHHRSARGRSTSGARSGLRPAPAPGKASSGAPSWRS